MLSRASTHLRRMEEETVDLQVRENSTAENTLADASEAVGADIVHMDIDSVEVAGMEDNAGLMIPQIANAASVAGTNRTFYRIFRKVLRVFVLIIFSSDFCRIHCTDCDWSYGSHDCKKWKCRFACSWSRWRTRE
jgi:hypothetical protein